jgi:hypothetical protein
MGTPTPVFQRVLKEMQFPPGRMIVPGAGRGHDAREFARHGFEVVAVDFAQEAAQAMREAMTTDSAHQVLQQDLFTLPQELDRSFDYWLEYTCYCAIDPKRRSEYADLVARLVKEGGIYIGLLFPLDEHVGGPPFAVKTENLLRDLSGRGFAVRKREFPFDSVKPRRRREELVILEKVGG